MFPESSTRSAPNVDQEVRWCLLKLADILIRPVEETPPTVKLHIPSTPVLEAPPQSPSVSVKMPLKPSRSVKSGGPPHSPLIPASISTKLKIPGTPAPDLVPRSPAPSTPVAEKPKRPPVPSFPTPAPAVLKAPVKPKGRPPKLARPDKPEKLAQVPKAQTSGMSLNDIRASRNALKKLRANKHAVLFSQPVDPVRDNAPQSVAYSQTFKSR